MKRVDMLPFCSSQGGGNYAKVARGTFISGVVRKIGAFSFAKTHKDNEGECDSLLKNP